MNNYPHFRLLELASSIDYGLTASAIKKEGPRFLRITDLQNNTVNWDEVPSCDCSESEINKYVLRDGDIVFARTGATTGKSYLICSPPRAVFASYLIRVRPNQKILPSYLAHFFRTSSYWNQISVLAAGAAQPGVNASKLANILIPTPPMEEQRRIAAIFDKVDNLSRKRQQSVQLADDFLRATFLDIFGDPVTNPKNWPTTTLENCVEKITSGWSANSVDEKFTRQNFGVLKVSAVSTGYFLRDEAKVVDAEIVNRELIYPKRGDLLFSRANTRELVAACCIVEEDCDNVFLPDKLWRIEPQTHKVNREYLKFLISHEKFKEELTKKSTGTSGSMLNISQAKLLSTDVPIPPIELQKQFAEIVWKIFDLRKLWMESGQVMQLNQNSLARILS